MVKTPPIQSIGRICVIDPESVAQEFARYENGDCHVVQLSNKSYYIEAFNTTPAEGFEFPENFPECCESHKDLYRSLVKDFNKFPDCCTPHRLLPRTKWFDKASYLYTPMKTMQALAYTLHWIKTSIDKPDWYKKIYDYIENTIKSYGQLPYGFGGPVGLNWYTSLVESNIPLIENVPPEKLTEVLGMVDKIMGVKSDSKQIDLNMLIGTYKEWLRIFPFELPYLSRFKAHFSDIMPILKGPAETNTYTGLSAFVFKSKEELLQFLNEVTDYIITELNAGKMLELGQLTVNEETEIKILTARRRLEIEELRTAVNPDAKVFVKLLRKWLKGEKSFIEELRKVMKPTEDQAGFLLAISNGIRQLQQNDTNEPCIINIRQNGPNRERSIQYWFRNFLAGRYPQAVIPAEEQSGQGRMDLKFYHPDMTHKVIEFKGWWNFDKKEVAKQTIGYLTDFEGEGFILMINHLPQVDITEKYRDRLTAPQMVYINNSWKVHPVENSAYSYFSSEHNLGGRHKQLFHFIFNAYF
jgi:hypothetical protein